jgi:hypothetical protein
MEGATNMAAYFAEKIMDGSVSYEKIFACRIYKKYQDDVDAILTAEGKTDLIKR